VQCARVVRGDRVAIASGELADEVVQSCALNIHVGKRDRGEGAHGLEKRLIAYKLYEMRGK